MAHRGVHGPPYEGVQGLLEWARGAWAYIDGECLRHNVDIDREARRLPANRFLNLLQSFLLDEQSKYWYPGVEADVRGDVRDQIDVMMYRRKPEDPSKVAPSATPYLEPNEEGYYPGLERAGRLDA